MDEYGTFRNVDADYDVLAAELKADKDITFTYCEDDATAYIVSICKTEQLGGPLPWGGRIEGLHLISVRRFGAEFFDLGASGRRFYPNYIGEKLRLGDGDAIQICNLLNALRERLGGKE